MMRGATYAAAEIGFFLVLVTLIGVAIGALFVSLRRDRGWHHADGEQQRAENAEAHVHDLERRLEVAGAAIRELEIEQQGAAATNDEVDRLQASISRLEASAAESDRLREIIDERDVRILELEQALGERETDNGEVAAPIPEDVNATTVRTGVGNIAESAVFFDIRDRDTEPA
jgi:predicted RNase H-like nuclease (RuvC/YqgF family)